MDTETALQLTVKQQAFCREYLVDFNATQAAVRAGYSIKTARQQAAENMTKPDIQQRVQALVAQREQATLATAEYVVTAIKETIERAVGAKEYNTALKGLELLGKHLGMFTDNRSRNRSADKIDPWDSILM